MCGIIGYTGADDGEQVCDVLLSGLSGLEYRGYDSAGLAVADRSIAIHKCEGEVTALEAALPDGSVDGAAGIGHTRWSTHGPPSDVNAHPHTDCTGRIAVVHNGIIENYRDLREALSAAGHSFESETDTEVVPHLLEAALDGDLDDVVRRTTTVSSDDLATADADVAGSTAVADGEAAEADGDSVDATTVREAAFRRTVACLEGSYAVAAVFAGDETVYAARHESPLVLGIGEAGHYLASDVPAFIEYTDRVIYLDDGEYARVTPDRVVVTDERGRVVDADIETIEWDAEDAGKSGYDHYMLKEIHEQPAAIRGCLRERVEELTGSIELPELTALARPARVQFVACGTSYHAALYGAQLLRDHGIAAQAFLASEYGADRVPVPAGTLVVGVTQSGETADTMRALREAAATGATTLAVTNVVGSSAAREADHVVYIRAGPEIGVAATKTFASQQVALAMVARVLAGSETQSAVESLRAIPDGIQQVLDESLAREVAETYLGAEAYFFIGRGLDAPVAREGALKMKEITYKHAEGFAAGELKHGPLALVTEETPVFATITGDDDAVAKTLGNVREVRARNAPVIAVTDRPETAGADATHVLPVPPLGRELTPVLANVQLQLVSYWSANLLGRSIDKPRNLAKSVTVE
ncbi:glucosamine--fructose-6-phosphate aminotransferase, isomerizing [Halovivax ruber XH-70]|uniref:Glutamine--fructose-6-phosphate aminotransferase [isomerizing] n=1 Tax=Halovivax ruber (strain DSM 18193 / JCM 13892 / XH-70) TaxID=797302 RepID=L0ID13_HALRX|nr:glutamine--fructose-6-phosphate transaminase (isomerizing) [Halovivax ruber]AGB17440.1 glucosamine--fructose-6-phosphate aminotransferase, isomerizing [Halovivax ruber XH-70]